MAAVTKSKPKYFVIAGEPIGKIKIGSKFYPCVDAACVERTTKDTPKDAMRFTVRTLEESFPAEHESEIQRAKSVLFARHKKLHPEAVQATNIQTEGKVSKRKSVSQEESKPKKNKKELEVVKLSKKAKSVKAEEPQQQSKPSSYSQFEAVLKSIKSDLETKKKTKPSTELWKPSRESKSAKWQEYKKMIESDAKYNSEIKMKTFINKWRKESTTVQV